MSDDNSAGQDESSRLEEDEEGGGAVPPNTHNVVFSMHGSIGSGDNFPFSCPF